MSLTKGLFSGAATLAGLCALTAGSAMAATESNIHLTITGDDQTHFRGECLLRFSDGTQEAIVLDGSVPLESRLRGSGLACQLQQTSEQGSLQVEVRRDGNVSRSHTQGKGSTINLRVG